MKAGLLLCDHVPANYVATYGDYTDMFVRLFPELDWTFYDVINGQFPEDLNECEVYFATGSHKSVYDDLLWIHQLKHTIKKMYALGKYFIGICFGHQLLGEALGGRVTKAKTGACVGVHSFNVIRQESWMTPPLQHYNMLMFCQDQVTTLPKGAVVLAGNDYCPVGMFRVGERMLGIQGHPEFSKAYNRFLIRQRVSRIGDVVANAGLNSLDKNLDTLVIQEWVKGFLSRY